MADNPFTRHPTDVGESYGHHLASAGGFGLRMVLGGLGCMVHAIFPFLFEETGSRTVRRLHAKMTRRVDKPNWERHPII
jgi:hypothetical protein